jgi:hypothetical protein
MATDPILRRCGQPLRGPAFQFKLYLTHWIPDPASLDMAAVECDLDPTLPASMSAVRRNTSAP